MSSVYLMLRDKQDVDLKDLEDFAVDIPGSRDKLVTDLEDLDGPVNLLSLQTLLHRSLL